MRKIDRLLEKKNIIQFFKFSIIGVSNTAVSYISYLIVIALGGHYVGANIFGYVTGTLNAFIWNNGWVFKAESDERRNVFGAFLKMIVSYAGTGIILNNIFLIIWVKYLGISKVIAPLINSIITMFLNFVLNKIWVFRRQND